MSGQLQVALRSKECLISTSDNTLLLFSMEKKYYARDWDYEARSHDSGCESEAYL